MVLNSESTCFRAPNRYFTVTRLKPYGKQALSLWFDYLQSLFWTHEFMFYMFYTCQKQVYFGVVLGGKHVKTRQNAHTSRKHRFGVFSRHVAKSDQVLNRYVLEALECVHRKPT
jgi:hypothetical protein